MDIKDKLLKDRECFKRFLDGDSEQYVLTSIGTEEELYNTNEINGVIFSKEEIKAVVKYLTWLNSMIAESN